MNKEKMQEQTEEAVENTEVKEENTTEELLKLLKKTKSLQWKKKLEEAQKQAKGQLR